MNDRSSSRLVDQLAGDGWLASGGVRLGRVTYAINLYEVRTARSDSAIAGTEAVVRLLNHSIPAASYEGQLLTLELYDGRQIMGFISEDGASLVRTGALA